MFVVQPAVELWFGHEWEKTGKPLPDGYRYASNTNPQWLDVEKIREMVEPFEVEG
jgi:UDP-N-acetylglucosamine 4,6-dehydratase